MSSDWHSSREPLSGIDSAWLRMERATNPLTIVGVMLLAKPIRLATLRTTLAQRLLCFHRFRQRPVHDTLGTHWEDDPGFELDAHVRRLTLPARSGQAQLEAAVSQLASTPLDPHRPLWQFHLIERYRRGSVLIGRFHHCYGDGSALLRVVLSLTQPKPGKASDIAAMVQATHAPQPPSGSVLTALLSTATDLAQTASRGIVDLTATLLRGVTQPQATLELARQGMTAGIELALILLLRDDPATLLRGPLSTQKRIAWAKPLPLNEVKAVSKALGCTVNDVLLATVAGAFGSYLRAHGSGIDGVSVRALVPVNLRSPEATPTLGNHFGLVFAALPIGERNPLARLYATHYEMQYLKRSSQPLLAMWLLAAMGALPEALESQAIELFTNKASMVVSNVAGPQTPLYLAGALIEQLHFWVPQAGSIGIGVSLLTYDGRVHFGVMADRQLIAVPSAVTNRIAVEFERLLLSTILSVSTTAPSGAQRRPRKRTQRRR